MANNRNVMSDLMKKYGVQSNEPVKSAPTASSQAAKPSSKSKKSTGNLMDELSKKYLDPSKTDQKKNTDEEKRVRDWVNRYNALNNRFRKYDTKRNGGYTSDASGGYASDIDSLIKDFNGISDIAGRYGLTGARKYLYQLQDIKKYIDDTNAYMSQFSGADEYDAYQKIQREEDAQKARREKILGYSDSERTQYRQKIQQQYNDAVEENIRNLNPGENPNTMLPSDDMVYFKRLLNELDEVEDGITADRIRRKLDTMPEEDYKTLLDAMSEDNDSGHPSYDALKQKGYTDNEIYNMIDTIRRGKNEKISEKAVGLAEKAGKNGWTGTAGFLGARIGNFTGAISGTTQTIGDVAGHYLYGSEYRSTDPNALGYLPSRMAGAADSAISDSIEGENGNPIRNVGAFVYRGAANAADNLVRMAAASAIGGPAAGGMVNSAFSFTQGFQNSYREAQEKGGSPIQGLLMGSIDGGMEVFTESRTFERWMNLKDPELVGQGVYEWLKAFGRSIGNEIVEEEASYIANTVADAYVMANKSENSKEFMAMVAEGKTPEEARWELTKKYAREMGMTALDTAMSTVLMNGATGAVANYQYKKTYGDYSKDLVDEGLKSREGTASRDIAEKLQKKMDSGKKLSGYDLRRMAQANEQEFEREEADGYFPEYDEEEQPQQESETASFEAPKQETVEEAESAENEPPVTLEELSEKYGKYAEAMRQNYLEGQNAEEYDRAFQIAFDMGKSGLNKSALSRLEALGSMQQSQREIAYEIGEAAAAAQAKSQSAENAQKVNGKTGWHRGVVRGEGVKIADLTAAFNDQQRKAYGTLSTIAEATGIDIVLFKSKANDNGEFEGEQGRFKWSENAIYIDVNAGLRYSKDVGSVAKYAMLRTYGHEFTHFIEKWNPEQYNEFRKAVFSTMDDANELIETRLAQDSTGKMTYDDASREVVAEAMTDILEDSQFLQELAGRHPSVFETMKAKLKEFVENLKSYFKTLSKNGSSEARRLKKEVGDSLTYLEDIVKRFDAAAVQAVENYQKTVAEDEAETVSEKETVADSDNAESETASESKEEPKQAEAAPAETNEETNETPAPTAYQGFSITPNTERGTLEITFDSKPSEGVRDALKANKFRWSSKNKLWYGRGNQGRIAEIIDNAMNDRGAASAAGIREKLDNESSADEALKQAEKAAKAEEATAAEYADLGNKLSYLDSVTLNGLDFRILSSGGDNKVWNGRIDRHPDGPYPVYDARSNIYKSEDFQSRTEAIAEVLLVALNNNLLDKQEVINNEGTAEADVQGQEEGNGTLREDNAGGVPEPEQPVEGDSRLLDEVEAGAVQQSEQRETAGDSGAGGTEAGRLGSRPDSERDGRSRSAGSRESGDLRRDEPVNDTPEAKKLHETVNQEVEQKSTESPKGDNFVIGDSLNLASGEKARFKDNVSALKLIHQLNTEDRLATRAEQEVLAKYVGWGGLSNAFGEMAWNRETRSHEMVAKKGWEKEHQELRQLVTDGVITEEEYRGMSESTKNAHYTSMEVVGAMYDGLKGLGFQGGRMLEPSSGVGNFVGGMPADMSATVKSWTMVELDRVTGQIAKYLYPNNDVRIEGFQNSNIPDNYMDVAIGNVPFGNYSVVDRKYPKRVTKSIHNYFFAKSLDKVRPGGIVMFITSSFTMNSEESGIRQYIMDRADLLGAIRLPNTAFKGNAGTDVVTDILILKKRAAGTAYSGEAFLDSYAKQIPGSWRAAYVNEYFQNHPEMVLGTEALTRGMYGAETLTYNPLENAGTLGEQIRAAFGNIDGKMEYNQKTAEQTQRESERAVRKPKEGSYRKLQDGTITNGSGSVVTDADKAKRISGIIDVKDAYRNLVERIQQGRTADEIAAAREYLNKVYDSFVKENGYLNDPKNKRAIADDPDRFSIYALETDYSKVSGKAATAKKADIFTKDTIKANVTVNHAETVSDGLIVSINTTGGVDASLIARLTGKGQEEVTRELIDSRMAFKTREGNLEAPETYLSGNVRAKLREAEALARIDKDYQNNVEELRRVIPKDVPYDEIHVAPGAVWVPADVYADFVAHMLGGRNNGYGGPDVQVGYSAQTGEYKIKLNNARLKGNYRNTQEWGTSRRSFLDLFESLMGNGNVTVTDKFIDDNGNERRVVNKDETAAAQEKADKIKEEFRKWIWDDEARRTELSKLYNETYNALANPKYDGSDLTVNGINANFSLRPHQANAVKRIIASGGNTLLAHRVGAGKTLEMAAAAMKLRELGIVKKPVFAVPKSLVAQWGVEFHNYFPAAKLLVADDKSFDKANRKVFTNNIANGDFDAVILSYEQFGKIPMSNAYQQQFLQEQIDEVLNAIAEEKAENGKGSLTVKQMEKKRAQLEAKLERMRKQDVDTDNVDFEGLGIDALFVDEAHNFKNLQYSTRMQNVGGLGNADGSQRAFDLYTKIRYLQQLNGGRGVVFATATPVMNSMAEMYIMQKYLQSDMLNQLGITTFDAWAKQFGEVVNTYEIKPSGQGVRAKQVFSNFKNLNELQLMFRSFSDVLTEVPGLKIPKMRGGGVQIVECEMGKFQKQFMKDLEERANNVKSVDPSVDNMLKITSDGRKISYTQRMIDPTMPYEAGCKLYRCCENILKEYKAGKKLTGTGKDGNKVSFKGTQIVFCDMATPKGTDKSKANADMDTDIEEGMDTDSARLYEDMRDYLVKKGIPEEEIAFIHEANSDAKRKQLFADMNAGKVRVLIGSTGKMGVGMNAQRCVTAIHHLDAPWRPGDVEQRDGRAFRQGNLNDEVAKYVYVTTGSFDARLWDILDRKSGFINQIMNGDDVGRNAEDTGDVTLSAAEVKALASGNPMIKESVELADALQKLNGLKRTHDSAITRARTKLQEDVKNAAVLQMSIEARKKDIQKRTDTFSEEKFSMQVGNRTLKDRKDAGEALLSAILYKTKKENEFVEIGSFAGFKILAAKSGSEYSGVMQGAARYGFKVHINNPTLMAGQMAKRIAGLEDELKGKQELLTQTIADKAAQEKLIAQPFERQAELDEKRKRYDFVMSELNKTDQQFGGEDEGKVQYQLRPVEPIMPSSGSWQRTKTTEEAMSAFPNMWNVAAEDSEVRNPTQIASTVGTYRKIYDILKSQGFSGKILDASSGFGYGTAVGRNEYGFDVDDIEPYPDKGYIPKFTDYSALNKTYDVIISSAVLNVLPQDQRDALVVKMGEMLNDGGRMFITTRGRDVENLSKTGKNIHLGNMEWIETVKGSYQKGFSNSELIAYLQDALGDGFIVEASNKNNGGKFNNNTSVVVTKVKTQYQRRTDTLTDRDVLELAGAEVPVENLDAAEADALGIFRKRLNDLRNLQEERQELGSTYKEQQFGENVDRAKAAETLEKMRALDAQIQEAESKVLSAETSPALKKVLPRARKIVEQHQKEKDDVILKRWRDRRNNAAAIKKYRERIAKDVTDISNWIISPSNKTDMKHVPDVLKSTVIPFLTSIDFTSKRQLRGGEATKADIAFMKRLNALNDALNKNIETNGLYSGYSDLPPDFMERLKAFIAAAQKIVNSNSGQFVINQMTSQEMKELSDIVTALKNLIQNFNRFHANAVYQHVYEAGDASIRELGAYQDAKSRTRTGEAMNNFVFWQQIRPAYAFERFGSGGKAIYDGLRRGQAKLAFNTKEIVDFAEAAYTAQEVKNWEETVRSIKIGGKTVRMKVSQIMSFYELLKREQAKGHIFGQGIRVASFRNGKELFSDVGQTITIDDANRIIGVLTPRQIEVADKLQQFMQEKGGEWGNYVSMKRFGEKLFGEEHYFPINSDGRHLEANTADDEKEPGKSLYALLNMSFTKQLQKEANNRIVLYSIFDVFSNHMSSMAQYNSLALPVLDALKWFNYQQKEDVTVVENGTEHVIHEVKDSVRDQLNRVYGVPEEIRPGSGKRGYAENFIVGILKAFNGTESVGISADSIGLNALRTYNMAQVAYNLRVVVQQPIAITRAASLIKYSSIMKGMGMAAVDLKKNIAEMRKYSGIAAWKALGFYDTNISRGVTDIIKHSQTGLDKFREIGMTGAEAADTVTWAAMWSACKEEVESRYKIKPGDEHFFEVVTKLFEDVIYKTQVVDSVLTKNEFLRSKEFFPRATGSFMSEPTTTASMLVDAYDKYRLDLQKGMTKRQAWEKNGANIGRTTLVYCVNAIILAAVQAVVDAWRDDDKYEKYPDKWQEAFMGNFFDELMPFNKLPVISDVYDGAKLLLSKIDVINEWFKNKGIDLYGYEPASIWMQWFDPLVKAVEIFNAKVTNDKRNRYQWYGMVYKLLQAVSGMTGLPIAAITREFIPVWNIIVGNFAPSLIARTYEQKPETEIKYTFMDGNMTAEAARRALVTDAGMTEEDAAELVAVFEFKRNNPQFRDDTVYSVSSVKGYLEYAQKENVDESVFFKAWKFNSKAESDKDENGKAINGSKREKVIAYIDSLNLTKKQKDSLYYAFSYSKDTIKNTPWH